MVKSINQFRKVIYSLFAFILILCVSITPAYAWGRKIITKSASGSFNYSIYNMNYSFSASSVISYEGNTVLSQSDLAFSNNVCSNTQNVITCMVIPRQTSKYISGSQAVYTVELTRSAYMLYSDKVTYTFTYTPSDAGSPYSLLDPNTEIIDGMLVTVEVSEPYDIVYYE